MLRRLRVTASVLALAGFALLTALVATGLLTGVDAAISEWGHAFGTAHPGWVATQRVITRAGDTLPLAVAGAALAIVLLVRRRYAECLLVLAAPVVSQILSSGVRALLARDRPVLKLVPQAGFAFPSGHTLHATTAALLCVLLLPPSWRRITVPVALLWAGLVGISRVALVVHWPSDVLGGWLLALGTVPLLDLAIRGRSRAAATPAPGQPYCGEGARPDGDRDKRGEAAQDRAGVAGEGGPQPAHRPVPG